VGLLSLLTNLKIIVLPQYNVEINVGPGFGLSVERVFDEFVEGDHVGTDELRSEFENRSSSDSKHSRVPSVFIG
jgi:hypothetical protein